MSDDEDMNRSLTQQDVVELCGAVKKICNKLPNARKIIDKLTGGLSEAGLNALKSRLNLYQTEKLIAEAERVAGATAQPLPVVLNSLAKQRRIDEITVDAFSRVSEKSNAQGQDMNQQTAERWLHTFYEEAGKVDENILKEAFTRILVDEIECPGTFSVRTLRILGGMSQLTAERFRKAVSVSIQLNSGSDIQDARICSMGGQLGQNHLLEDGLSYDVLIDLTENALVHSDYGCSHPYGPPSSHQFPFFHQGKSWMLIPSENSSGAKPLKVVGAKFTSCGVELLKIVDVEPLPDFTSRLEKYFLNEGYRMVPATN